MSEYKWNLYGICWNVDAYVETLMDIALKYPSNWNTMHIWFWAFLAPHPPSQTSKLLAPLQCFSIESYITILNWRQSYAQSTRRNAGQRAMREGLQFNYESSHNQHLWQYLCEWQYVYSVAQLSTEPNNGRDMQIWRIWLLSFVIYKKLGQVVDVPQNRKEFNI